MEEEGFSPRNLEITTGRHLLSANKITQPRVRKDPVRVMGAEGVHCRTGSTIPSIRPSVSKSDVAAREELAAVIKRARDS